MLPLCILKLYISARIELIVYWLYCIEGDTELMMSTLLTHSDHGEFMVMWFDTLLHRKLCKQCYVISYKTKSYTILHYIKLYQTIPCHTMVYCAIQIVPCKPCCTLSYHTIAYHAMLYHPIPYHPIPYIVTNKTQSCSI